MAREPASRPIYVSDLMVLVAATAAGLAAGKVYLWHLARLGWNPQTEARFAGLGLVPFVGCWSLALVALRFRSPRPRLRDALRHPGTLAVVVACATVALRLAVLLAASRIAAGWRGLASPWWVASLRELAALGGLAVLTSWFVLAVAGRRRRARDWIDRLGLAAGLGWVALLALRGWIDFGP
ncbi:MAG TPA: hypothetical protein VG406_03955 [Isosphaeraceae bacterium]|jgi:hypothetical protein|nr:hypothetical protein [Isosphaeraceae bacterium]